MYMHHRQKRVADPIAALAHYELERRHREAEHARLAAQVRRARLASRSTWSPLRQWLGARLPARMRASDIGAGVHPGATAQSPMTMSRDGGAL
jgi:hypothetical protein